MNTLTAVDIRILMITLKSIDDCFEITADNQKRISDLGRKRVNEVRSKLLSVALADVAVEPAPAPEVVVMAEVAE
jgi:hypothetical protein